MKKVMLVIEVEDDVNLEDIRASITIGNPLQKDCKPVNYRKSYEEQQNNKPFYGNLKFKNMPDKKYMKEWDIKNEKQASDYVMLKCFYDGYNACVEDLLRDLWSVYE